MATGLDLDRVVMDVEVLRLEPGDKLCVTLWQGQSATVASEIQAQLENVVPSGVDVLVFSGTKITVLRDGAEDEAA